MTPGLAVAVGILTDVSFVASLGVALVGIVIALQLEFIARQERRQDRADQYGRILAALDECDWLRPMFLEAAESAVRVRRLPNGECLELEKRAAQTIEPVVRALHELARGRVRLPPRRTDALIDALRQTRSSVQAVTFDQETERWWSSRVGEDYWEVNRELLRRGVMTERIFLCDEVTGAVREVLEAQRRAGVRTLTVIRSDVPLELQGRFAVYDEKVMHSVTYNSSGEAMEYVFSVDTADVEQALDRFDRLRSYARDVPESEPKIMEPKRTMADGSAGAAQDNSRSAGAEIASSIDASD